MTHGVSVSRFAALAGMPELRADGYQVSTSTVERALRRRGLLLPSGFRADRRSWSRLRKRVFRDPPRERNRVWQMDFSEFETTRGGIWRICSVIDYATKYCLANQAPAPIAVVTDNGPCFRGTVFADAFTGDDPLLRHVRTRVRSPQTNGVVERFVGTLKYEHLYRAIIGDGNALAVEVNCFRHTYNTLRPHQALGDRTPRQTYLAHLGASSHRAGQCS